MPRRLPTAVLVPAALVALAALAACDDDALAPVDRGPALCAGEIALTVAPGAAPTFSWAPACGVSALFVRPATERGTMEQPVWAFGALDRAFGPQVRYGVVPAGATGEPASAPALVRGARYRVDAVSLVGGDVRVASGTIEFTAP